MSMTGNVDASSAVGGGRFLGFWTILLIFTLNASNGKDLLDVLVPWVEAQTQDRVAKEEVL